MSRLGYHGSGMDGLGSECPRSGWVGLGHSVAALAHWLVLFGQKENVSVQTLGQEYIVSSYPMEPVAMNCQIFFDGAAWLSWPMVGPVDLWIGRFNSTWLDLTWLDWLLSLPFDSQVVLSGKTDQVPVIYGRVGWFGLGRDAVKLDQHPKQYIK